MAKTRDELRTSFGKFTRNSKTANLDYGETLINDATRRRLGGHDWWFLEDTRTLTSVASQQFYKIPADVHKVRTVTVTVGTTSYTVKEAPDTQFWNTLNESVQNSDTPEFYIVRNNEIGLYPTPSTAGNTITIDYKKKIVDISNADYTTGTISITNGATAVTGSGTTFTEAMVGRYLKTGDGYWYLIASYTSATSITLDSAYLEVTVSGGSYTIAELSQLPDGFELMGVFDGVSEYYLGQEDKQSMSDRFKLRADELEQRMKIEDGNKTTNVRADAMGYYPKNPNNYIYF